MIRVRRRIDAFMGTPEFSVPQGGENRYSVLAGFVKSLCRRFVTVLEVGSFEGQSALVWSGAIAQHCSEGGHVLCVDPWSPQYIEKYLRQGPAYVMMSEVLSSGEAYARFCRNATCASLRSPIGHIRGTLRQAAEQLRGQTFDIVYIDGDHAAFACREDIERSRSLVGVGGLLCGDDLEVQGGDCDDWEAVLAVADTVDYVSGMHPGVTVAVWEAFGRVASRNGVWAVQKTAENSWCPPAGF
jgi:hypothetical protein